MPREGALQALRPRRSWSPYAVLIISLLMTVLATWYVARGAQARDQLRFRNATLQIEDAIEMRVEAYVALLRATRGVIVSRETTRDHFREFVAQLRLAERYPGVQGIGYAQRVRSDQLPAVTEALRAAGVTDFAVRPPGAREEYFPIVLLEPMDRRNRVAIGYDMFSEPTRRAAMERARDEGLPAATGRVTLVQEIDADKQPGFLIYLPVYGAWPLPTEMAERRRALRGFVYAPFRVEDLLEGVLGAQTLPLVDFWVYDGSEPAPEGLMHAPANAGAAARARPPRLTDERTVFIAGRPWTLIFETRPAFEHDSATRLVPLVLLAGALMSVVLFGITRSETAARGAAEWATLGLRESERALRAHEAQLEHRVAERTAELHDTHRRLRSLAAELTRLEQRERRRIAQGLHEHQGQILAAIKLRLETLTPRSSPEKLARDLEAARALLLQAIQYTRTLTFELSPPVLYELGLGAALGWLAEQMHERHGLTVEVVADPAADPQPEHLRVLLFHAVQELLLNVVKHAQTDKARVTLSRSGDEVRVVVEDRGVGAVAPVAEAATRSGSGFGLFNIRERLEYLGGRMEVDTSGGEGMAVALVAPLDSGGRDW